MLDILDVINEATKEANSFENHAAKELTLEERLLYLQGLALVMNADGEIHPEEKEYIRILIKSFDMDESILESFVEFAEQPDKDTIQAFFRAFRRRPIAQLFLFDALMMTRRDDKIDEREKAVVDKIAEQLEVLKGTYQDIYDLFCHIKNKDWDESALYFSSHLLNPEHFKHLLDYFEVDIDTLTTEFLDKKNNRLLEVIRREFTNSIAWEDVTNTQGDYSLISKTRVRPLLPKGLLISWLQSLLDKALASIRHGVLSFNEIEETFELKELGIEFNYEDRIIMLSDVNKEKENCSNGELISYYCSYNNIDSLDSLLKLYGASDVAKSNGRNLPCLNGKQVSAITSEHSIGDNGHPNAISSINKEKITIRWCNHCKGGHGSTSSICDDSDKRFTEFDTKEFILEHGLYLVK